MTRKFTLEEFIQKAVTIHGSFYDYSNVEYKNNNTHIIITCKTHGAFKQVPSSHLSGNGCSKCAAVKMRQKFVKPVEKFIEEVRNVHGDNYNYDEVKYNNMNDKITIECAEHGRFLQRAMDHLKGQGCPTCGKNRTSTIQRRTVDEFIEKAKEIHGNKYEYSDVNYINNRTDIVIKCKNHGIFSQTPYKHLLGRGCRKCVNKTEGKVLCWLYKNFKKEDIIQECIFEELPDRRFDFYLENYNLIIEIDGRQHFEQISNWQSPIKQQKSDIDKMEFCINNGISVIRLFQEDVYNNTIDWEDYLLENIQIYETPTIMMYGGDGKYDIFNEWLDSI